MKTNPNDPYSEWLEEKREKQPSADFADRVMTAIAPPAEVSEPSPYERLALFSKAAVLILAAVAGFSRYGLLIYFVLFGNN